MRYAQAQRIRRLIVGKLPDQLKLPFYLWTRAVIASLIAREYGTAVSLVTLGRYLRGRGLSPQKPVRRAYEKNHAAIARWLKQEYPAMPGRPSARCCIAKTLPTAPCAQCTCGCSMKVATWARSGLCTACWRSQGNPASSAVSASIRRTLKSIPCGVLYK